MDLSHCPFVIPRQRERRGTQVDEPRGDSSRSLAFTRDDRGWGRVALPEWISHIAPLSSRGSASAEGPRSMSRVATQVGPSRSLGMTEGGGASRSRNGSLTLPLCHPEAAPAPRDPGR